MRVDLGDGQWAELKEVDQLRRSDQKAALRAMNLTIDPETKTVIQNGVNDLDMADAVKPHMELINKKLDPAKRGTDPTAG